MLLLADHYSMKKKKKKRYRVPRYEGWYDLTPDHHLCMMSWEREDGRYWVAMLNKPKMALWAQHMPAWYLRQIDDWPARGVAVGILKALAGKAKEAINGQGRPDAVSKKKYPALVELLTEVKDDAGGERELSSLTIKWQQGAFVIGIHEPNLCMSLWATGDTLDGTLECLERRINADDADWRRWSDKQAGIGGKKKR